MRLPVPILHKMRVAFLTFAAVIATFSSQALAFSSASLSLRPNMGQAATSKLGLRSPQFASTGGKRQVLGLSMGEKQTFKNFDDMIANSKKPLLVDFYAVWCGPCVLMGRELSQLSETMEDKISVVKIDTEKYPKITERFDVYALPTCILFKDGEPIERVEGVMKHDELKALVESKLA